LNGVGLIQAKTRNEGVRVNGVNPDKNMEGNGVITRKKCQASVKLPVSVVSGRDPTSCHSDR